MRGRRRGVGWVISVIRRGPPRGIGPATRCGPSARTRRGRDGAPSCAVPAAPRRAGRAAGRSRRRAPARRARRGRTPPASSVTTTVPMPRDRSAATGRIHVASVEAVMRIAVMPRRRRPAVWTSVSTSGVAPSPSTAARSCMTLRCWRAPRSAGRIAVPVGVDRHAHRPVLEDRLVGDGRRDPDRDLDRRFVTAAGLDRPVEVEDDPGVGRLLELELLDLDLAVAGRRPPVDPVEAVARRPRPDGRRERRRLERPLRGGLGCPRRRPRAGATAGSARSADRRRPRRPGRRSPTPRRTRTGRRSGSGAARSGSGRAGRAGPGRATTARPADPAGSPGRAGRPAAWSGCGPRATAWGCGSCSGACRSPGSGRRRGR